MIYNIFDSYITIDSHVDEYIKLSHSLSKIKTDSVLQLRHTRLPRGKYIMSNVVSLLCTPIYQALQMTVESLDNLDLQYTCEELMNNRSKELDFFFDNIYIYENACVDIIEKIDPSTTDI